MSRFESVEEFAAVSRDDWPTVAIAACRLAIAASGVDERAALDALRAVELRQLDSRTATSMRRLADRLDEDAWDAQEVGDENRYDLLFRRARAVSALAFAPPTSQTKRSTKLRRRSVRRSNFSTACGTLRVARTRFGTPRVRAYSRAWNPNADGAIRPGAY